MKDTDCADDLALLANTLAQTASLLHSLDQATEYRILYMNVYKKSPCVLIKKTSRL